MDDIVVELIYPEDFHIQTKELTLNAVELIAMNMSNKVGSEGKYFNVKEKIFEDVKSSGIQMTIILESNN